MADYYGLNTDGYFTVYNTAQDAAFGPRTGITGTGYCPDASGQCFVTFNGAPTPTKTNYQVIETDYSSYSVVYSCSSTKAYLWLLSREPVASDSLYKYMLLSAKAMLPNFDFNDLNIRDYQGSKCSYLSDANQFLQWFSLSNNFIIMNPINI